MGSFNGKGREQEMKRRKALTAKRLRPAGEGLEDRRLLSSGNNPGSGNVVPLVQLAAGSLTVNSITPGGGLTYTNTPNSLVVTFSKAVQLSSINSNSLTVTGPTGVTVKLGTPTGVDDPNFPTQVSFPFVFTRAAGANANAKFTDTVNAGTITAKDGSLVSQFTDSFTLNDTTSPRITNATFNGRTITIAFSEQIDQSTINQQNIALVRAGGPNNGFNNNPANVIVTNDSRVKYSYNASTQTVTIDLSGLPQTLLPTDHYALVVNSPTFDSGGNVLTQGVTDQVGNALNGKFNGVFPSGITPPAPPAKPVYSSFVEDLGVRTLTAPIITSVGLAAGSDSGIANDNNTNVNRPTFTGHITAPFPGTAAGVTVLVEFNGLQHTDPITGQPLPIGTLNLNIGPGGRGFTGSYDAVVTTDANGNFTVVYPAGLAKLPDGLNRVRFLAIAQPDAPPLPGFSVLLDQSFRVDTTLPGMDTGSTHPSGASLLQGATISSLSNLSVFFSDSVLPSNLGNPLAVPTSLSFPALDPATANNLSNYSLYQVDANGKFLADESQFIKTATFVSTTVRTLTSQPYTGHVDLTFSSGLPKGYYIFVAHTQEPGFSGLRDAAGNLLAGDPTKPGVAADYKLMFNYQPEATFITNVDAVSPDGTISGPRSYFEVPLPGTTPRAEAPPNEFVVHFSNPLNPNADYTNAVQLIASADANGGSGGTSDGNFGSLGINDDGSGYSRVLPAGTTVTLASSNPAATSPADPGFNDELILQLPDNFVLSPDYYRLYLPNSTQTTGNSTSLNTAVFDIFGNQLDGEFLGNQTADGSYQDLLPTGAERVGLSGDGTPGGAFLTGYVITANANIIYAQPGAPDDPFNPANAPDGSIAHPFPTLAPQAVYTAANGGDLNSSVNFGTGFNPIYDRMHAGVFHRSALYAAQVASAKGPVVVVALPAIPGTATQSFVIQAPSGTDAIANDGSVSVPAMTTLVFAPGSTVKLLNASILVQNQGSAIQVEGGANPGQAVNFTSYLNDAIAGDTNGDQGNTTARGGDWGGILLRNFDQTNRSSTFPGQLQTTANTAQNNRLKGPGGVDAISGADDAMSVINFANISFGGGAVPQTIGFRYDAITLQNARPAITNTSISQTGLGRGAQAAISANVDSLREDATARGPLVRDVNFSQNSLNGIYIRAEVNGVAEATNAINYPINPATSGGQRNFTLSSPYPYILTTPMVVGGLFLEETGGVSSSEPDRLYIQPGMMVKLSSGAGIEVVGFGTGSRQASINIGSRTYINEFDINPAIAPTLPNGQPNPNFKPNPNSDANVVLTSIFDNLASTQYFDPTTGLATQIVAPSDSANTGPNSPLQPTTGNVPDASRWGGIQIDSPAVAVINDTTVQFGGGLVNTAGGSTPRHALQFVGASGSGSNGTGTHVSITNNNWYSNADTPIQTTPNGLLAADPLRPLQSGNPFLRGNVFQNNDYNGLGVTSDTAGAAQVNGLINTSNGLLTVNSVWGLTDLTYILKGTIVLGPGPNGRAPIGAASGPQAVPAPGVTLTVQANLPGTILADGSVIGKPGESPIVKLLNINGAVPSLPSVLGSTIGIEGYQGAGFISGVDNGVDPSADSLVDTGVNSALRFVGIGANQTTGQARVPVIITSMHDSTVGTTVRGVTMNQAISGDTTAPAPGDGGNIEFGALGATSFNFYDPRLGSIIDNADIRYMSNIIQQGGGIVNIVNTDTTAGVDLGDQYLNQEMGQPANVNGVLDYSSQFNTPRSITLSNSNFSSFSGTGFYADHGHNSLAASVIGGGSGGFAFPTRLGITSEPTYSFLYNNTFSNMPNAVQVVSQQGSDNGTTGDLPAQLILLNNTFYQTGNSVVLTGAVPTSTNPRSHVYYLSMNNIYDGATGPVFTLTNRVIGQSQNDLFFNNASIGAGTTHAVFGDPAFIDPNNGNFNLLSTSAAIDSARSEIGPYALGNMLSPPVDQVLGPQAAIRDPNNFGRTNLIGGLSGAFVTPTDYIFLPGSPLPNYVSEWVPQITGTAGSYTGPFSNAATFAYAPITGERDAAGNLRIDDPNKPNLGSGASPFFDIGAFEYVQVFPPHVTGVTANYTDPTAPTGSTTKSIYSTTGVAGTNIAPNSISFQLDHNIDPTTITNQTVLLQASGGDGLFGNGNSAADRFIDLSGKLSFNSLTNVLTISLANAGLILTNDEYRLELVGTGSQVLRDPQGNALDGENTVGGLATGAQLPLPSGDGVPGGNTYVTFTIDTNPPKIVPNTFFLDPSTDSNRIDGVTNNTTPNFQGNITDIFPPANPVAGQTVIIDISTKGDGVFDLLNAGTGTTDANGHFSVKINTPLPDSQYNVGANGYLAFDYTKNPPVYQTTNYGYSMARVRIVDQAGNVSNKVTDPLSSYIAAGAVTSFVVDTTGPTITAATPSNNQTTGVTANGVPVTITFNKNVDPATINANSIKVLRSGGDGVFGNGNDVPVTIDPNSISFKYLGGALGAESVTFNIIGSQANPLANDQYQVTIAGAGTSVVTDIAGNALNAVGAGSTGSNFTDTFIVYSPTIQHTLFVGSAFASDPTAKLGSRANPYTTIQSAINAAQLGDVVAVLPGLYTESITLKSLVTVRSADLSSTDNIVLPGDPLQTIIRAPAVTSATTPTGTGATVATVTGINIASSTGGTAVLNTEFSGFTVASPLAGNPATGTIQTGSVGIQLINANILIDRNFVVDSYIGIAEASTGINAIFPRVFNNGIIGNNVGFSIDGTLASSLAAVAQVSNNTFAFNNQGAGVAALASGPLLVTFANNIFWQNHDLTSARNGDAIAANVPNKTLVLSNLFSGNGANPNSTADDTFNIGTGFQPQILTTTAPDGLGNFTGDPAFVSPRDPRPTADGPASFFNDADFDLLFTSAAIDRSNPAYAPATDFLYRGRIIVPGRAFTVTSPYSASVGPADVGAFEYGGTGGIPLGGQTFRVVNDSLASGNSSRAGGTVVPYTAAPSSITVNFSSNVKQSSVSLTDLVISGTGISGSNPVRATSLSWIDGHTVKFNLTGGYNKSGTVQVQIPQGAVTDTAGRGVAAFTDSITLSPTTSTTISRSEVVASTTPTPTVVSIPAVIPTPVVKPKAKIKKKH